MKTKYYTSRGSYAGRCIHPDRESRCPDYENWPCESCSHILSNAIKVTGTYLPDTLQIKGVEYRSCTEEVFKKYNYGGTQEEA